MMDEDGIDVFYVRGRGEEEEEEKEKRARKFGVYIVRSCRGVGYVFASVCLRHVVARSALQPSNTPAGAHYINPKFPRSLLFLFFLFSSITYVEYINSVFVHHPIRNLLTCSLSSTPSVMSPDQLFLPRHKHN